MIVCLVCGLGLLVGDGLVVTWWIWCLARLCITADGWLFWYALCYLLLDWWLIIVGGCLVLVLVTRCGLL